MPALTAEQRLNQTINDLIPYVIGIHECTSSEARIMIRAVYAAIVHKLLDTGYVRTPLGRISFKARSRFVKTPLRIMLRNSEELLKFMNAPEHRSSNTAITELLLPKHYAMLDEYLDMAIKYKEENERRSKERDTIQKDDS